MGTGFSSGVVIPSLACVLEETSTTYVGDYLYRNDPKNEYDPRDRFVPFDPENDIVYRQAAEALATQRSEMLSSPGSVYF